MRSTAADPYRTCCGVDFFLFWRCGGTCFYSQSEPWPPLNPPKARHSSGRTWESLWEGLYIEKQLYKQTPDQPQSSRYVKSHKHFTDHPFSYYDISSLCSTAGSSGMHNTQWEQIRESNCMGIKAGVLIHVVIVLTIHWQAVIALTLTLSTFASHVTSLQWTTSRHSYNTTINDPHTKPGWTHNDAPQLTHMFHRCCNNTCFTFTRTYHS